MTYLTGNIVNAEPGFREQPASFLYLPLRLVIDHPADLFDAYGDPALDAVAAEFCEVFADLLARLDVPVPAELRSSA